MSKHRRITIHSEPLGRTYLGPGYAAIQLGPTRQRRPDPRAYALAVAILAAAALLAVAWVAGGNLRL